MPYRRLILTEKKRNLRFPLLENLSALVGSLLAYNAHKLKPWVRENEQQMN